jgi:hypothetical protein
MRPAGPTRSMMESHHRAAVGRGPARSPGAVSRAGGRCRGDGEAPHGPTAVETRGTRLPSPSARDPRHRPAGRPAARPFPRGCHRGP